MNKTNVNYGTIFFSLLLLFFPIFLFGFPGILLGMLYFMMYRTFLEVYLIKAKLRRMENEYNECTSEREV